MQTVEDAPMSLMSTPRKPLDPELSRAETGISAWLAEAGIEDTPGLTPLLVRLGGGGVSTLGAVNEAELVIAAGPLGLKGIKLRKLLAALSSVRSQREMPSSGGRSDRSHDSGTGGSAYDYLVAKEGQPIARGEITSREADGHPHQTLEPVVAHQPASLLLPTSPPTASPLVFTPPVFTPRTTAAIKKVEETCGMEMGSGTMTPRTLEAVKVSAQAMDDEHAAQQLQAALDEEASAAAAAAALVEAASNPVKGKPKTKKKSPTSKKSAQRKQNEHKATARFQVRMPASPRACACKPGGGHTRLTRAMADRWWQVSIGETKFTAELDKKLLAKPLLEAVVTPALEGYLADKPACVRVPLSLHPGDVAVSVDGEVVDGASAAKRYVNLDAEETRVILILPMWATDVITQAPVAMAEILGKTAAIGGVAAAASMLAGGLPLSMRTTADGVTTTTITTASAPFHVNITSAFEGRGSFETQTHLAAAWLEYPLREALVVPALNAYAASNPAATRPPLDKVQIAVDGKHVDGAAPASDFVRADGTRTRMPMPCRGWACACASRRSCICSTACQPLTASSCHRQAPPPSSRSWCQCLSRFVWWDDGLLPCKDAVRVQLRGGAVAVMRHLASATVPQIGV